MQQRRFNKRRKPGASSSNKPGSNSEGVKKRTGGRSKPPWKRKSASGSTKPQGPSSGKPAPKKTKRVSKLDPALLERAAVVEEQLPYQPTRNFEAMPLHPRLKKAIANKGFEEPTEIQDRTLEPLLSSRDLLGIAQTGTGKTGAFLIPIIHQLLGHHRKSFALVLTPTRELAIQIEDEFRSLSKGMKLYSACFIGGTNINKDIRTLQRTSHVVIATPGRLLDLVERKSIDLRPFKTLVLDEFDRMLDMGFVHDVKRIVHIMGKRDHNLLFSATLDPKQQKLIDEILHNPVTVKVSNGQTSGSNIEQKLVHISPDTNKLDVLKDMLSHPDFEKVLVFEESKHRCSRLAKKLNQSGFKADDIHGNKSQNARQRALEAFKLGKIKVLVATDVAARGIDVSDVTHVINYQVPMTMDSYIHRIGRTGRAGKMGKAFTFVEED